MMRFQNVSTASTLSSSLTEDADRKSYPLPMSVLPFRGSHRGCRRATFAHREVARRAHVGTAVLDAVRVTAAKSHAHDTHLARHASTNRNLALLLVRRVRITLDADAQYSAAPPTIRVVINRALRAAPALSASARGFDDRRWWAFGHVHVRFVKSAEAIALRGNEPRLDDAERVNHCCGHDGAGRGVVRHGCARPGPSFTRTKCKHLHLVNKQHNTHRV